MRAEDIRQWREDEATRLLHKTLEEARGIVHGELTNISPSVSNLSNVYFYLKGKLDGIDLALEADLGEEE
jgi:hypothetical protein